MSKGRIYHGYKLIELLGKGSFGRVWKGEHVETKQLYAIKVIKFDNDKEKEAVDKEEMIFKKLKGQSPYLVELIDSFDEEDEKFFVMELCESNINSFIKTMKSVDIAIPEERIWKILSQILLALTTLEHFKIIHRDIKGSNIFITKDNMIKIGDFGTSREILKESSTAPTAAIGTFEYMSPEIIKGKKYGFSCDIWSMGVVIYELMEFKLPFEADNPHSLIDSICNVPHKIISSKYSSRLKWAVDKMLIKEEKIRITLEVLLSLPEIQKSMKENNLIIPVYSSVNLLKTETNDVSDIGTIVEKGKKEYSNLNIYEGHFKNDINEGYGRYYSGSTYEGHFKNNINERYYSGSTYEGHFKNNINEGYGRLIYARGDIYEGDCKNNKREGYGRCVYASGDIYEGEWKDDVYEGKGKLILKNGKVQEGIFVKGKFVG